MSRAWVPGCLVFLSGAPDVVLFKNPSAFPESLWDCLKRHTNWDPKAQVNQMVLNTDIISQSAPDIRRKLQKLATGPNTNSTQQRQLLGYSITDGTEDEKEDKKMKRQAALLTVALVFMR